MLHEFLTTNRDELIRRCNAKVSRRGSPPLTSSPEHGIPLFLGQLVEVLRCEEADPASRGKGNEDSPEAFIAEGGRTAALHGKALFDGGYSVDQVVHDYGDVCQAVTELARESDAPVTVDEFHTLDRLLDNAIADAVSSYGLYRDTATARDAQDIHERVGTLAEEQRQLLDTALKALDAVKVGNIGLMGATGTLLEDSLMKLRALINNAVPGTGLSSAMATPPRSQPETGGLAGASCS